MQRDRCAAPRYPAAGGTSFDRLYVHVNGESGYFERSLQAYGRAEQPCARCGTPLQKIILGGRSTTLCPVCQVAPIG
ncbi:zinc finger domain-containing protein [Actinotignum timonense]|nr:zinc finger domain-containing protein [Actinotignum timonense]